MRDHTLQSRFLDALKKQTNKNWNHWGWFQQPARAEWQREASWGWDMDPAVATVPTATYCYTWTL